MEADRHDGLFLLFRIDLNNILRLIEHAKYFLSIYQGFRIVSRGMEE